MGCLLMNARLNFDVDAIRRDFPILAQTVRDGKPLIYLDSAATSQKPRAVIDALNEYYEQHNANVHRGIHHLAEIATERFEEARRKIAAFIGATNENCVVFTRGTTEGINLVAHGWGRKFIKAGDEIITSEMEHHSNLVPWQMLCQATGATLKIIPFHDDGTLNMEAFHRLLSPKTKLVAITQQSNVLGTVNPVAAIAKAAHAVGAKVLVDGAQSVPHMPVNVSELDCDFLAFSGHKMCGPTGIGALYIREEIANAMDPFMGGGEMISKVMLDHSTWAEIPHKFEAGTPDISGAIVFGAAIDYLNHVGMPAIHDYEVELTKYAIGRLETVPTLKIYGKAEARGGAVSFSINGAHPHDISHFVDKDGIAIRAGHMCAQPLLRHYGVGALSRASLYFYNTKAEIDALVVSLDKVRRFFNRGNG